MGKLKPADRILVIAACVKNWYFPCKSSGISMYLIVGALSMLVITALAKSLKVRAWPVPTL